MPSSDETTHTNIQHHEPNRAGIVVSVRLKADEAQLLHGLADRDGRSLSETLRVALHAFSRQPPRRTSGRDSDSFTRGGVFTTPTADLMLR